MADEIWIIDISGYGSFVFRGNEADCEHMRQGKARWERAAGRKWLAEEGLADPARATQTASALLSAVRHPASVANQNNYGSAPAKESNNG